MNDSAPGKALDFLAVFLFLVFSNCMRFPNPRPFPAVPLSSC
jgi:hypothetical protein